MKKLIAITLLSITGICSHLYAMQPAVQQMKLGTNELIEASKKGNSELVKKLLAAGINVNAQVGIGMTPLIMATASGHKNIVKILLDAKADPHWGSPIVTASEKGYKEIVQMLLNAGANVNAPGGLDQTALMVATIMNHKDIVQMLLDAGANRTINDIDGKTAFDHAKSEEIRKLLRG